jgi:Holliday junction resolvasome RuvABC endonuclease subunit
MRIIGIDPGTRIAGYGIIDIKPNLHPIPVAAGAWKLETVCDEKKNFLCPRVLQLLP